MNRIVLIGNGFDLAHDLKTSYKDFIEWYWREWGGLLEMSHNDIEEDRLCSFKLRENYYDWFNALRSKYQIITHFNHPNSLEIIETVKQNPALFNYSVKSHLFNKICKEIDKSWFSIEDIYYTFLKSSDEPKLINDDLEFIKDKLVEYLNSLEKPSINNIIKKQILAPISQEDIAIGSEDKWKEMLKERLNYPHVEWQKMVDDFRIDKEISPYSTTEIMRFKDIFEKYIRSGNFDIVDAESYPTYRLPDNIMLLNFNYTSTADLYLPQSDRFTVNHIHGSLSKPESVIFGYGDERDDEYEKLMKKNDNEYLRHIKSFRYLDASNYRRMLAFIESDSYQICIMGHSCGVTDRTLLSTLFEHPNCVSIKPYYYRKDDGTDKYRELVQNIGRNFSDPRLMRDRVVGKELCEPLGKE
jgi:hypothetical protein